MYRKLRAIHLATAAFCLAFLGMYSVTAVQMAHRRWFPITPRVTRQTVPLAAALNDARVVARQLNLRGELGRGRISAGQISFRVARPGTVYLVTYRSDTGEAAVTATETGVAGALDRIHQSAGLTNRYLPLNAWSAILGLVSLGLLTIGATGLYLWFRNREDRLAGTILLVAGSGLALLLMVSMRI